MRRRGKIALTTVVLTAFAAVLVLWSFYDHAQESLEAAARSKLETVLQTRTAELVRYLNAVRIDLDLLATAAQTATTFGQLARHWPEQQASFLTTPTVADHGNITVVENRNVGGYVQLHQQLHPSLPRSLAPSLRRRKGLLRSLFHPAKWLHRILSSQRI